MAVPHSRRQSLLAIRAPSATVVMPAAVGICKFGVSLFPSSNMIWLLDGRGSSSLLRADWDLCSSPALDSLRCSSSFLCCIIFIYTTWYCTPRLKPCRHSLPPSISIQANQNACRLHQLLPTQLLL